MKNRVSIILLSIIFIYTLFGFLILPMIIKSQIEKNLNELLIPTASLQKVEFNPFTIKIKLHNFLIKDATKELIKFKELSVDFSVLKSIHKKHISFKEIRLADFFINVIQNKDGSINLLSLLKKQPQNKEVVKENKKDAVIIPFKISKTVLNNARIKVNLLNGDKPLNLDLNKLNYTFYELGTYKNSLASHSLDTIINKDTKLKIAGAFNLIPFKMYGNIDITNLRSNDYLPYSSDLFNFDTSNAIINLNFGYQIDLSKGIKVRVDNTNLQLKELYLSQNKKKFTGLKSLEIQNLSLRYPEQKITIAAININKLFAHAIIDKKGNLNFASLIKKQDGHRIKAVKEKRQSNEKVWDLNLKDLNINNANINFNDVKNKTSVNTKDININLNNITLLGTQLNLNKVTLKVSNVKLDDKKNKTLINTKNINVNLNDISLLDTKLHLKKAILKVSNIKLDDKKSKTKINSNKFMITMNNLDKNQDKIKIKKLNILQPYTNINSKEANIIAKNLNLDVYDILNKGNYLKVKKALLNKPKLSIIVKKKAALKTSKKGTKKNKKVNKKQKTKKEPPFNLDLGPFKISRANIIFEDKNLPIPFKTNISKLNGDFSEFITKSSKPTKLNLEGQVDKYGYTKITGLVDHKNIKNLTDVQVIFKNIAINNFTPYSGKFVGRELKGGKLNLNLKYNISKSNINAKNSIVITDIKLGKNIESPDAMSLPLELAIALMEDSNGVIDLNLPISGNVDDPQFSIAPIIWKAFSNLIIKAITSPFSFLASLFDFDEEEIKSVEFAYGNSQLIASEKETLDKIAQIFAKRPNIALKVQPTFNSVLDKKALQTKKFELFIDKEMKLIKKGDDKYLIALENNYLKYKIIKPLKELKKDFISKKDKKEKDKDQFNKDAYLLFLKDFLISKQIVLNKELKLLAVKRASSLSTYLQTAHKITANRVIINEKTKDDIKSKDWVAFDLEIGVKK